MRKLIIALSGLASLATAAIAQPTSDIPLSVATPTASLSEGEAALARALTDYIPHVMRQHSTPGLAIAVSQDRRIIYDAGFGYKDIQSRAPMTADTTFFTGSMAKTVVAFAAMQLVEEGVLELDVPVNQYLTAFQIENPLGGGDVTLRHLLTHQTGLSTNPGGGLFPAEQPVPLLEEHLTNSYENAPEFNLLYHGTLSPTWGAPVGEKWQYSNRGTATIGYLVEIMNPDGLSLEAYLDQKVFGPLSMNDTQHPVLITEEYTRADLWERRSLGNTRVGQFLFGDSHKIGLEAPAGGIITTVSDFVRLPMAFIEGGTLDGGTIAAPETIEAMLTPAFDVGDYDQGLMWKLDRDENDHPFRFWHPGGAPNGHTNVFGGWPALGMATVMHTNSWPISSGRYEDMYQIEDFILRWKAEEQELGHPPEFRSWAWKTSYVLALLSVEAEASVGTPRSHFEEYLDTRITLGSVRYGHPSMSNLWDENGFRAGVTDAFPATGEVTMSHIENLANGGLAISKGDFLEIYANLGGAGSMIPNFWE